MARASNRIDWCMSLPQFKTFLWRIYKQIVEAREREVIISEEWKELMRQVSEWTYNLPTTMLILTGGVGNGKTTILQAIRDLVNLKEFKTVGGNESGEQRVICQFYNAKEIFDECQNKQQLDRISRLPIIAIDDFGTEPVEYVAFGNATNPLSDLLFKRYERMNITLISSNLSVSAMKEKYDERLTDRFREMATKIEVTTPSYR